ncbi:hypothetical protein AEAC466_01010 [Asticcacaulis sp. AC466]|uniref:SapC family protein n=1 Tax=Asticcacaulis sp. AC466 TaxID=1282362 RepID=UPI0003C412AB|nr:SapC family protein [Asticcacaulis sp. AC466]ESQ85785.1 hypothetical protein AEAC466_01010 [Asticcacaulis sp. AC466]
MVNQVPLSHEVHSGLRIMTHPSARFGSQVGFVGVIPREYTRLVAHYPIFFRKNAENGRFEPGVLLGFNSSENLFLIDERWDAAYAPLHIQRQPFLIAQAGEDHVVTLDIDSPRVQREQGELMFHDDGRATDYLQRITSVLTDLAEGTRPAYDYAAKLAEYDLIESIRIDVQFVDHSEVKLEGLYAVSAEKLQALAGDKLVELRDLGYLTWAYYQLASMSHVAGLVARKNRLISGLK